MLRSVLTVDAGITIQDARATLAIYPDSTDIVIRRRESTQLYWYTKRVGDIRQWAAHLDSLTISLKEALNANKCQSSSSSETDYAGGRFLFGTLNEE